MTNEGLSSVVQLASSFDKTRWVWHDGRVVSWQDASVHVSANAVQYGCGVFEGIRCYNTASGPAVFRLRDHIRRLYASAEHYGITIPYEATVLEDAICESIQINGFVQCYIRPICYYGSGRPGVGAESSPVHVAILAWPWETLHGAKALQTGLRITVSRWKKFHFTMMPTVAKACGGYINSMLATHDAQRRGYDEAVLLDMNGNVSEGPRENIFIIQNRKIVTNDQSSSILLGVTRDSVIKIGKDLGYDVEIRTISVADLTSASEAFFCGTAAEITPICEMDGSVIGSGVPGPITLEIQRSYFAATSGQGSQKHNWLRFLETAD